MQGAHAFWSLNPGPAGTLSRWLPPAQQHCAINACIAAQIALLFCVSLTIAAK
jgi:hypothetical protein